VTNIERLGCEGVRLHFHVSPCDLEILLGKNSMLRLDWSNFYFVDEAGFADVGEAAENDGTSVGVDGGQTG